VEKHRSWQPTLNSRQLKIAHEAEMLAALGYGPVGFERRTMRSQHVVLHRRFDVILVSHASQISAGLDLAHALHEVAPTQPLLLATASTLDVGVNALAEAGISELLRRPLVSTEVASALARWLRSSDMLQP
jgi:AmiR/NasT family two-component response regulator